MSKIMVVAAAAAGYVLGSRAGREHYEAIAAKAQKLWRSPQVQQAAAQATEVAKNTAEQVTGQSDQSGGPRDGTASSGGRHAAEQPHRAQERHPGDADELGAR